MLTRAAPRRHAFARVLEHGTLLPFLYQTRTIARHYSDHISAEEQRRPGVEHVPFDGEIRQNENVNFEGSTITPQERRSFEALFKLKSPVKTQSSNHRAASKKRYENVIDKAKPGDSIARLSLPLSLQRIAQAAQEKSSAPSEVERAPLAAIKQKQKIITQLEAAQTDIEIWNILQDNVFKHVAALNLDTSSKTTTKTKTKKKKDKVAKPATSAAASTSDLDLDTLTHILPSLLTTTHRILNEHFPSSPLSLSILPTLRSLGPSAFALGASTHLYNLHLRALYSRNLDLDGCFKVLQEMDEQVYAYDAVTEMSLVRVLQDAKRAREGVFGEGVKRFWEGERIKGAVEECRGWIRKVRAAREEEALRIAKAEAERKAVERQEEEAQVEGGVVAG